MFTNLVATTRQNTSTRRKSGFTLIELLVVIAIIAILAAILFPVFARARENARRSSCQSNQKQLGLGIMQYTQDYDERFPIGVSVPPGYATAYEGGQGWAGTIYTYIKSVQVYKCPSDSTKPRYGIAGTRSVSYGLNSNLTSPTAGIDRSIARLNSSAKTVMLCELSNIGGCIDAAGGEYPSCNADDTVSGSTNGLNLGIRGKNYGATGGSYATGFMGGRSGTLLTDPTASGDSVSPMGGFQYPDGRHLEGSNFLFADGHVKWLKGDAVSTGTKASSPADAQNACANCAQGTDSSGAYAVTFSPI